jgi:hypothetical protein
MFNDGEAFRPAPWWARVATSRVFVFAVGVVLGAMVGT